MILFMQSGISIVIAVLNQTALRGAVRSEGEYAICGAVCVLNFQTAQGTGFQHVI